LLRRLSTLHALHLYNSHRYSLSIDAFIRLDLSPAKVVALFPETISGKLFVGENGKEELFGGRKRIDIEREKEKQSESGISEREEEVETNASSSPMRKGHSVFGSVKEEEDDRMSIRSVGSRLTGKRSWLREREPSVGGMTSVEESAEKANGEHPFFRRLMYQVLNQWYTS